MNEWMNAWMNGWVMRTQVADEEERVQGGCGCTNHIGAILNTIKCIDG